jgi:hypothetical protein
MTKNVDQYMNAVAAVGVMELRDDLSAVIRKHAQAHGNDKDFDDMLAAALGVVIHEVAHLRGEAWFTQFMIGMPRIHAYLKTAGM